MNIMEDSVAFLFVFVCVIASLQVVQSSKHDFNFDVIPGGAKHTVDTESEGVKCTFTYVCQGGTKEAWQMSIQSTDDKSSDMKCIVLRPSGVSYLFFQEFQVEVEGAEVKDTKLKGSNQHLQTTEYQVRGQKVSHTPEFKNSLTHIEVVLSKSKQEL